MRFGAGALADAPELLAAEGFEHYVLLTTERAREQAPEVVGAALSTVHVPSGPVPKAAAAVREAVGERAVVALGGGRVIDAAKGLAAAGGLPCAALPTTLSGAEMTPSGRPPAGTDGVRIRRPVLVVADPALMASQGLPGIAASAMNALGHALEALYVPARSPVAEWAALRATTLIARGLATQEPERESLALGSLLAAYAMGSTGFAVHHVICQTLVRAAGTPHAATNAVMLPHCVALMARRAPQALAAFAGALADGQPGRGAGGDARPADLGRSAGAMSVALPADPGSAVPLVAALAAQAGATRLADLGVQEALLGDVARAVHARQELRRTPEPPTESELLELLERAL